MAKKKKLKGKALGKALLSNKKLQQELTSGRPLLDRTFQSGACVDSILGFLNHTEVVSLRTICRFVYHSTKKCDKYCSAITLNNYSLGSIKALKGGNIHKATIGPICTSKAIRHVTVWTAMGKALGPTVTDLKVNDAGMWYYQEGKAWVDKVLANMPNVETLTLVGCRVNILVTPTHQSIKTLRLSVSDSVVFGPVTWLTRHSIQTILRPFEGCPLEVIHIDNIAYDWTAMDEAVLKSKWPQLRSVVVGEQWSY